MKISRENFSNLIFVADRQIICEMRLFPYAIIFLWRKIPYKANLPTPIWGSFEFINKKSGTKFDIAWIPGQGEQLNKDEITKEDAIDWFSKMLHGLKIEKEKK
jgi:hypothetical protein